MVGSLTSLTKTALDSGSFSRFHFNEHIHSKMLQFADDIVLICEGSWSNMWCINSMVRGFEYASGLHINLNKIKLYVVHLDSMLLQATSTFLVCEIRMLPFMFLIIPMGGNHRDKETWSLIISKLRRRLASWHVKHLSFGGKLTLLISVLHNIPTYMLSFFKALKGISEKIIKIQREFLWGNCDERGKACWVSWDRICFSKKEGGLRVKNI